MDFLTQIPDTCPKCSSRIVGLRYEPRLRILAERSYRICENQECDFQETNTDYQQRMGFGLV